MPSKTLSDEFSENQYAILPPESKGIGHHDIQFFRPRLVGHIVKITIRTGIVQVDGGWNDTCLHGLYADYRLQGAGRSDGMAGHGLG